MKTISSAAFTGQAKSSAIVRIDAVAREISKSALAALPTFFRALSAVSPQAAALAAEKVFFTPPHFDAPDAERKFLAAGHAFTIPDGDRKIAAWSWGDGPTVFMVHGWGGRGGQFHALVKPLVDAGYSVVLFDAPAHGASKERRATVIDFARALKAAVDAAGPAEAIVTHSMGAGAATLALARGLVSENVVFISPPARFLDFTVQFSKQLGLSSAARALLQKRIARQVGVPWERLSLPSAAPAMTSRLLVIHDRGDPQTPIAGGREIVAAWPGAELHATEGLGHYRILRSPEVVGRVVKFITENKSVS